MAPTWMELAVTWLSVYVYRGVPLLSLSMHLILAIFSESRRREDHGWKRLLVWVAYQLTDWGPAYVISNLYLETKPPEKMIIAFWVPFLLLHHARPDNISVYTIEDSLLWIRLIVSVLPKSGGSFIIVYRFILTDCAADWSLRWASSIMLFLGIWKYLESAVALWLSNLGHICKPKKPIDLSDVKIRLSGKLKQRDLSDLNDDEATVKEKDDEALLVAHGLFEICKGAFCDYMVVVDHKVITDMFCDKWETLCTVVEMELSLMYDILYTKAAVVYTLGGYAICLASPLLTATALLLFVLHCKEGMKPVDIAISYILLLMTFLLDVRWLFRALASSWTHAYFERRPQSWLKHEFWCLARWKKLRCFVVSLCLSRLSLWLWACECGEETKSYRRWAGTFGQCNLLDQCTGGNRQNLHSIPRRLAIESGDHSRSRGLESEDYLRGREIPDYVKKLVFGSLCKILFPPPVERTIPEENTNTDTPGPGPDTGGGHRKSPGSPGKSSTGLKNHEAREGTVISRPEGSSCKGMCPTGSTNPDQPSGTVTQCLQDVELPEHYTCVYPVSPDPDDRCLGPPYPKEWICNGIHDEPPPWLHYPRGWICTGVGVHATPCLQYPRQQICIGINDEPPRLPCPWQVRAGMRNGPFEENRCNALARPHGHPEEQAAEDHWSFDYYEQAPPEAYEQAEHSCVHGMNRFAHHQDTPNTYVQDDDQAKADTDQQHGDQTKHMESDQDMEFPPELQEVILIWHIATDVFLSCMPGTAGDKSIELEKAIEQISDYMMFLVAKRSEMLPGLKLRSLYKNTQDTLKDIWEKKAVTEGRRKQYTSYVTKEKEELAKWMPGNMDSLLKGTTTIVWEGTQLARVLLNLAEGNEQDTGTVERLAYWVPELRKLPRDVKGMLKLILDAWVRLLMYASIRCSRDSHAKQLSRGGELTTLVWIITEHAEKKFVKEHLPLLFPPKKEKTE